MKISKIEVELFCTHCNEDTISEVVYYDSKIESIRCTSCGRILGLDYDKLLEHYKYDWVKRIITKPHRMTDELRKDLYDFIKHLPVRMLTKPKRIHEEVEKLRELEKEWHK